MFDDANGNGRQDVGEVGMAGQIVFIDQAGTGVYNASVDPVAATDANGNWAIGGLVPGTYTVINQLPAGYNRTLPGPSRYTLTVAAGGTVAHVDFGADALGYINGTVFYDANANGVLDANESGQSGWLTYIDNNRNGTYDAGVDTAMTSDGTGYFVSGTLPVGQYLINQVPMAGWGRSSPALPLLVNVTERTYSRVNFGETRASITGKVFNDANANGSPEATEAGIAGVQVFLDFFGTGVYQSGDLAVTTDANGTFTIGGMAPGTYTVAVTSPGSSYAATTATSYTLPFYAGQVRGGYNFGFTPVATTMAMPASLVAGDDAKHKKPGGGLAA